MRSRTLMLVLVMSAVSCVRSGFSSLPCEVSSCLEHGTCGVTLENEPRCLCDPGSHNNGPLICEPDLDGGINTTVDAALDAGSGSVDVVTGPEGGSEDRTCDAGVEEAGAVDAAQPDSAQPDSAQPDVAQPDVAQAVDGSVAVDASLADRSSYSTGTWVHIPGGSFEMGCSVGDTECSLSEEPRHTVTLQAFEMQSIEVTQGHFLALMGFNPSHFSATGAGDDCGLNCPVEMVTWHQARAVCEAMGGRLPSEAEWEYAARAGATTRYACGDDAACLADIAWYSSTSGQTPHPVGRKSANAFDLYDVQGNVWEWVEDCWHGNYTDAPDTGEAWLGESCDFRVLRGGSWINGDMYLPVSYRSWYFTSDEYYSDGVRCAR